MSYSNEKIKPSAKLTESYPLIITNNIRSSSIHKSNRDRQCYCCLFKILKGEDYINHQYKYDGKIVTTSFHKECF